MSTPHPGRPMRRSSIGQAAKTEGATPPSLNVVAPEDRQAQPEPPQPPTGAGAPATVAPQDGPPPQSRNKRIAAASKDILLTMPEDEKTRMVNTITNTAARTGIMHQSKYIRFAISKLCEELEQRYNNGEPFDPPAEAPL